jgi:hypothetical protein
MVLPEEIKRRIGDTIFSLHGGQQGFDCWISKIADAMATANSPGESEIARLGNLPDKIVAISRNPHEVVDTILSLVDRLNLFSYELRRSNGKVEVVDSFSGHIIEELQSDESNLQALAKKYEVNDGPIS